MRFSISSAALLAASTLTQGIFANVEGQSQGLEKRAFEGINGIPGNACARREVRDLARANWDQWTLFLLALQRFMDSDQSQKYSYYQIAGIHGRPFSPWGDVQRKRQAGDCPHGSPMFMPWHAPYLSLFEKAVDDHMTAVIASYPANVRARWEAAHNCFRLPFWDSARRDANEDSAPVLLWAETVTLETPTGRRSVPNPLFAYTFHPTSGELGDSRWQSMSKTYRRVINPGSGASSNNGEMRQLLNNEQPNLRNRILGLMRNTKLYRLFSTEATGGTTGNPESHDSAESIHNSVHIIAGGPTGGHMYYLDYAGFDPLFWLHHANIDRWGAIWRKINPNSYVESSRATQQNSFTNVGDTLDWNTPLLPFPRNSNGQMWTPNDVRYTETFSYFYPETAPGSNSDSALRDVIRLYGSSTNGRKRSLRPLHARTNEVFEGYAPAKGDHEFTSVVSCDKFALEGSYAVHFFLEDASTKNSSLPLNGTLSLNITLSLNGTYHNPLAPVDLPVEEGAYGEGAYGSAPAAPAGVYDPEDPASYPFAPGYIGTHGVMASVDKMNHSLSTTGFVPLLTALQKHYDAGLIPDLSKETCAEYLKKHLTWKVVAAGNQELHPTDVPALTVSVISQEVLEEQTADSFGSYAEAEVHPDITADKPAGNNGDVPVVISPPNESLSYTQCPTIEPEIEYQYVDEEGSFLYSSMSPM